MLGLDRGIAAGFYRRNERIGMPIVTVPGRRRQLRQEPTISVVCRAAHGFLRSTGIKHAKRLKNGGAIGCPLKSLSCFSRVSSRLSGGPHEYWG
jgi:hypothetical protein